MLFLGGGSGPTAGRHSCYVAEVVWARLLCGGLLLLPCLLPVKFGPRSLCPAAPVPISWFSVGTGGMHNLHTLRLAGNNWSPVLDPAWATNSTSWWVGSLRVLDLDGNPLDVTSGTADIPSEWRGLQLRELLVSPGPGAAGVG